MLQPINNTTQCFGKYLVNTLGYPMVSKTDITYSPFIDFNCSFGNLMWRYLSIIHYVHRYLQIYLYTLHTYEIAKKKKLGRLRKISLNKWVHSHSSFSLLQYGWMEEMQARMHGILRTTM